jgi:hypothetical protein
VVEVVNVVVKKLMCPGAPWARDPRMNRVGEFMLENALEAFRGVGWQVFKELGLTPDDIEQLVADAKRDAQDPKYRWFATV